MFAAIAPSYDTNNRVHSLWRDQAWRRAAVRAAGVRPGIDHVVDVACGTGDLTFAFAQSGPASITGIDFVPEMIQHACAKAQAREAQLNVKPEFAVGDAMNLALPDDSADIVSIAFGIRNVEEPSKALAEFRRILRPGGRVIILEFAQPVNPILKALYQFYFTRIMPRTATWISRDRTGAYKYFPRSVSTFLSPAAMCDLLTTAGFVSVTGRLLTFGICRCYRAEVDSNASS